MPSDDYTKHLEEEIARYALPNPYRHKRRWRLLFLSSDGRMVHAGNYRRVITCALILLCVLAGALSATTTFWLRARTRANDALAGQHEAQATLARLAADQERLMARLALAEEKRPQAPATAPAAPPKVPETAPAPQPYVRIDTINAQRAEDGSSLKVSFKLFNDTPKKDRIKGTLFLAFLPKEGTDHTRRCLPPVLMKGGAPADPTRGESFQMRNFTTHTFRLRTEKGPLPYNRVILYAFDEAGDLRYKNQFTL